MTPDSHLPVLTKDQADRLRGIAAGWFIRNRMRIRSHGDHFTLDDGGVLSLDTLARRCAQEDEGNWRELIDTQLTALTHRIGQDETESVEFLRERAYLRLLAVDSLPFEIRYARPVTDDLVEVVCVDLPDVVRVLNDDDVARAGLDELRRTGRANLLAEPVEHDLTDDVEGVPIHILRADSMFVATKALVLDQVPGVKLPPDGALVALPTRHVLAYHRLGDASPYLAGYGVGKFAFAVHDSQPGPLSPHLYWWRDGRLHRMSRIGADGTVEVHMTAELEAVFARNEPAG